MSGLIYEAYADQIAERLGRTNIVPVMFNTDFNPLNNNWHKVVNHRDIGTDSNLPPSSLDVFVGEVEIVEISNPYEKRNHPYFLYLDLEGNDMLSVGTHFETGEPTLEGFKVTGALAGVKIVSFSTGAGWTLRYKGYLIKAV